MPTGGRHVERAEKASLDVNETAAVGVKRWVSSPAIADISFGARTVPRRDHDMQKLARGQRRPVSMSSSSGASSQKNVVSSQLACKVTLCWILTLEIRERENFEGWQLPLQGPGGSKLSP